MKKKGGAKRKQNTFNCSLLPPFLIVVIVAVAVLFAITARAYSTIGQKKERKGRRLGGGDGAVQLLLETGAALEIEPSGGGFDICSWNNREGNPREHWPCFSNKL